MTKFSQFIQETPSTYSFNVKIGFNKPSDIVFEGFSIEANTSITITALASSKEEAQQKVATILEQHKLKYEFVNEVQ